MGSRLEARSAGSQAAHTAANNRLVQQGLEVSPTDAQPSLARLFYSSRNACSGSIFAVRRAGR